LRNAYYFKHFVEYLEIPGWTPRVEVRQSERQVSIGRGINYLIQLYFLGAELDAKNFQDVVYDAMVELLETHSLSKYQLVDILDTIGGWEHPEVGDDDEEAV
jgi:hypothetical protein